MAERTNPETNRLYFYALFVNDLLIVRSARCAVTDERLAVMTIRKRQGLFAPAVTLSRGARGAAFCSVGQALPVLGEYQH
jgi:hypothetical protein